jgi:hypothetical protein
MELIAGSLLSLTFFSLAGRTVLRAPHHHHHSIIAINTILIIHHPSKHHILDDVYGTSRSTAVLYCSIDNISTTTVHYDRVDLQY